MDPRIIEAMQHMTPEKAKEMLEQMSPEERQRVEQVQKGMADLQHLVVALKPDSADPDASASNLTIVKALAGAPMLCERMQQGWDKFGETVDDAVLERLEKALVEMGALEEGALSECAARKNALLLYWHMNRSAHEELAATFPTELDAMRSGMNQLATQLLVKAQMLMPQQRWVQQTLAVARVSALVANGLASHTDPAALAAMAKILEDPDAGGPLPMPKLTVSAAAKARNGTNEEDSEVTAGQQVLVTITVTREHAASPGDAAPQAPNPQGIYEAYWVYLEGLKPEGTPNSLITAQPMPVKDLTQREIKAEIPFQSPPAPGKYDLKVHVLSTSVIGVELSALCDFTVVEDDVPELE